MHLQQSRIHAGNFIPPFYLKKFYCLLESGGPDGELGASLRYLSQRYSMPYPELKGLLTDIGTEELGHLEMVAS
ncbi:MAG: manganese catalase family protein, partial [Synergistaceae bacterium]|nr:manganese catalase family protein [Synergistaceae bacterium]